MSTREDMVFAVKQAVLDIEKEKMINLADEYFRNILSSKLSYYLNNTHEYWAEYENNQIFIGELRKKLLEVAYTEPSDKYSQEEYDACYASLRTLSKYQTNTLCHLTHAPKKIHDIYEATEALSTGLFYDAYAIKLFLDKYPTNNVPGTNRKVLSRDHDYINRNYVSPLKHGLKAGAGAFVFYGLAGAGLILLALFFAASPVGWITIAALVGIALVAATVTSFQHFKKVYQNKYNAAKNLVDVYKEPTVNPEQKATHTPNNNDAKVDLKSPQQRQLDSKLTTESSADVARVLGKSVLNEQAHIPKPLEIPSIPVSLGSKQVQTIPSNNDSTNREEALPSSSTTEQVRAAAPRT